MMSEMKWRMLGSESTTKHSGTCGEPTRAIEALGAATDAAPAFCPASIYFL
jgi:hypothetical protein